MEARHLPARFHLVSLSAVSSRDVLGSRDLLINTNHHGPVIEKLATSKSAVLKELHVVIAIHLAIVWVKIDELRPANGEQSLTKT
ncbi:uncharacterized protein B0I36DRAFT_342416, partial [Microdochium trichocladiopsis]